MKKQKSKAQRGLIPHRIVYANRKRPHDRNRELRVDIRRGTIIDKNYATGLVALGTPLPLDDIQIIRVTAC